MLEIIPSKNSPQLPEMELRDRYCAHTASIKESCLHLNADTNIGRWVLELCPWTSIFIHHLGFVHMNVDFHKSPRVCTLQAKRMNDGQLMSVDVPLRTLRQGPASRWSPKLYPWLAATSTRISGYGLTSPFQFGRHLYCELQTPRTSTLRWCSLDLPNAFLIVLAPLESPAKEICPCKI